MSGSHKSLFRYSDDGKVSSSARIHMPNTSEQSREIIDTGRVSLLAESAPFSALFSERSTYLTKDGVTDVECETRDKATKRLNIPFDEMVYQDLISLNEIRMKLKSEEFSRLMDRPRRHKKLDPEPDLVKFFRPTKQEFLFFDLLGRNFDPDGEEVEIFQDNHNFNSIDFDDKVSNDFIPDTDGGSESSKPSTCEEFELENHDVDTFSIEKFRILHENYCLDPPKLNTHFEGSSLYKRSHAWKLD